MKLGIDFGTCYSSASLMLDGIPTPVKEPLKQVYSFPSSVFLTQQGNILIGQAAENQRRLAPDRYCHEFKRYLGQEIPYSLGDNRLLPEDLVSKILEGLKTEAEKIVHQPLNGAIVTVPATYQAYKKELMEQAAKKAGFEDTILLEEPVAAAIYYAHENQRGHQLADGEILLVYDLGGGTFDAALIQKQGVGWQLLTQPVGDANCGGIDFDREIYQNLRENFSDSLKQLLEPQRQDIAARRARLIIGEWCRDFKHQLSVVSEYADLLPIGDLSATAYSLSQQNFHEMIARFIDKTCQLCQQLLEQANLNWKQVNRILLVGGSSRIPYIQQRLEQEFSQSSVVAVDEPELAICFGAAIYGKWLETEGVVSYCQAGETKINQGNYIDAIADFERAIRLNADYAPAYMGRGKAYFQQGLERAIADYEQALKLDSQVAEAKSSQDFVKSLLNYQQQSKIIDKPASPTESDSNLPLETFEFETVTVNRRGEIIKKENHSAQFFTEDLGNGVTLEMVAIPGGTFIMGAPKSEEGSYDHERPQHRVTVPPFYMGKFPITQAQWRRVAQLPLIDRELDPSPCQFKGDQLPIERVTWYDAVEFCKRLSKATGKEYRLPSEAEWEYACRAVDSYQLPVSSEDLTVEKWNDQYHQPFHFGETITSDLVNYDGTSIYANEHKGKNREKTTPVGSFLPNAFGLYDLHGNVWEWCADSWHDNYEGAPTDGSAWLKNGNDNRSPLRGGLWNFNPSSCRSAYRDYNIGAGRAYINNSIGFRVVCGVGRTN